MSTVLYNTTYPVLSTEPSKEFGQGGMAAPEYKVSKVETFNSDTKVGAG